MKDRLIGVDQAQRVRLRRVLTVLCVTEITSWGILYYAFPVLAPTISAATGWSAAMVTAAFTVSQVTAGIAGVPVGRLLDRHGPRQVMTIGSIVAVAAVLTIATSRSPLWFFAGWLLAGTAMSGVLYAPAFAALTRWFGPVGRVRALTVLTLIAGLASTVFAPLTAFLAAHLDWREVYVVLAVILAVVTIPGHVLGLRLPWPAVHTEHSGHTSDPQGTDPARIARSGAFVALVVAMSLGAFAVYAVVINSVPLLTERGLTTSVAALALGLGGLGQVLGRLGYARLARRTGVRGRTVIILLSAAGATALLGIIPGPAVLLIAASILAGTARGVFTLLQATAVTDRWGAVHYGRLNGLLSAPMMLAAALAPWAGAVLAGWLGGYPAVFAVLAGLGVLAAALAMATSPAAGRTPARSGRAAGEQVGL